MAQKPDEIFVIFLNEKHEKKKRRIITKISELLSRFVDRVSITVKKIKRRRKKWKVTLKNHMAPWASWGS